MKSASDGRCARWRSALRCFRRRGAFAPTPTAAVRRPTTRPLKETQLRGVEDTHARVRRAAPAHRSRYRDVSRRPGAPQRRPDRHDREGAGGGTADRRGQRTPRKPQRQRRRPEPIARESARRHRRRSGGVAAHGARPAAGDPGSAAGHGRGDPRRDDAGLDGRRTQERDRGAEAGSRATGGPSRLDRQGARRPCSALGESGARQDPPDRAHRRAPAILVGRGASAGGPARARRATRRPSVQSQRFDRAHGERNRRGEVAPTRRSRPTSPPRPPRRVGRTPRA